MEIDEDIEAFLVESYETLEQLESDLLKLEKHPPNPELIQRIYRSLHTLKGNAGYLNLDILPSVAHGGENLLTSLENGQIILTPQIMSLLLQVIDAIQQILACLETRAEEGHSDYNCLLESLANAVLSQQTEKAQTEVSSAPKNPLSELEQVDSSHQLLTIRNGQQKASIEEQLLFGETEQLSNIPETTSRYPITANLWQDTTTYSTANISDSYIRVDVKLLDKLINLAGELVVCRNQILEFSNKQTDTFFADTSQRLDLITKKLQEGVMRTRMQPIAKIWRKFPRLVRDLSISLGKEINLEMEGEETELDTTLIEAISSPLTHLVNMEI